MLKIGVMPVNDALPVPESDFATPGAAMSKALAWEKSIIDHVDAMAKYAMTMPILAAYRYNLGKWQYECLK